MEKILYEFPLTAVEFYFPKWMDMLPIDHAVKQDLLKQIRELMNHYDKIRDVAEQPVQLQGDYVRSCKMDPIQLWSGIVQIQVGIDDRYYYEMLSGMLEENVEDEYQLLHKLKELAGMKKEYTKVQDALTMVRIKGYGVVTPDREDIALEKPELIEKTVVVYRLLPKDVSVEVFSYLPSDDQLKIVDGITDTELSYIVDELDFDDKIDILEELPANLVDKILEKTPKNERALINSFLNYPDDCAGSLMTPEYISLQKEMTVGEALGYIKREGMDAETIYTCYVKDAGRKLIGIVSLSTLVITDDNVKIKDIMHTEYIWLNVYDDKEDVAEAFKKYDFLAMPVVDKEHRTGWHHYGR